MKKVTATFNLPNICHGDGEEPCKFLANNGLRFYCIAFEEFLQTARTKTIETASPSLVFPCKECLRARRK